MRRELAADAANSMLAVRFARTAIDLSRADGDPRFVGQAQAALAPWWNSEHPPLDVLILRATIHGNQHAFDAALADLDAALARDPRNTQALLTKANLATVRGAFDEARKTCGRLLPVAGELLTAACLAAPASMSGNAASAYALLARAYGEGKTVGGDERSWILTTLAEIAARRGEFDLAERHFRAALALGPIDAYLKNAYADFLLDRGRTREARTIVGEDPTSDGALLRLAIAERSTNASSFARRAAILSARFTAARTRGDRSHLREEARFALQVQSDATRALALALENWNSQREAWDARLVLESALAAKQRAAAQSVLDWLRAHRTEDVQLVALAQRLEGTRQ